MELFKLARPFVTSTEEAVTTAVQQMKDRIVAITGGKVMPTAEDMQKWWNDLMGRVLQEQVDALWSETQTPTAPKPPSLTAPTLPPSLSTGGRIVEQHNTFNLSGSFLMADRDLLQKLAALLKPELDKLVAAGV